MLPGVNRRVTSEPPLAKTFTESVLVTTNSNIHGTSPWGRYPDAQQILSDHSQTARVPKGLIKLVY